MRITFSVAILALLSADVSAQEYSHEPNTYRFGGTYSSVSAGSPDICAILCSQDRACIAWSYRHATSDYGPALCELKQTAGSAEHNPLMTSGINPRIASEGQVSISGQPDGLLGGASGRATTVIRNSIATSQPSPAPFRPTPAGTRIESVIAPVPRPQQVPKPRPQPLPAPQPVPQPTVVSRPAPSPPPVQSAPVIQTAPSAPASVPERIEVPVEAGQLPPNAILRDAPPPQVSFAPPTGPAPEIPAQAPIRPDSPPEGLTLSTREKIKSPPRPLETVPAGTIPAPQPTAERPYNGLGSRPYPNYSVTRDTALTPEELAAGQAEAKTVAKETVEDITLDNIDLATDVGEPLEQPATGPRSRRRTGGGGS